ncbi:D-alanyl-D-alanine carboxypeptidase family protein [Acidisoma cladoniae]|jgi:D-alanyl-D-alanine carboxypeptidase|uniref:D-alanyl-D-alanine carboxypeptidase family protein n=1 Tax=Acidisoma cladoniae TaxID=3040935 RepID=UPI002549E2EC|nr:serine hydrolase [Acidisoma sp. PAMC 29798]
MRACLRWPLALCLAVAGALTLPSRATRADVLPPMSSIIVDAHSGQTLFQAQADAPRYPASLTKLMTLYMLFEALRDHRITLNQMMPVSEHAADVQPVKLGVRPGARLSVEESILGMVTLSANDAATAAGEFLAGGDETRFGALMTLKAHTLGMDDTVFRNASGLPDPAQITTAHDLAILARRLIQDFPDEYHYFSTPSFLFHGRVIFNHDNLLKYYPGADGMKTGYTNAAGHNLVSSALRGGVRLIGVVMAAPSNGFRDHQMMSMLDDGFATELGPAAGLSAVAATVAMRRAQQVAGTGPVVPVPATLPNGQRQVGSQVGLAMRGPSNWSLDLGSYPSKAAASTALRIGMRSAGGGVMHLASAKVGAHRKWHAWIASVSPAHARAACSAMNHYGRACTAIRPAGRELAER